MSEDVAKINFTRSLLVWAGVMIGIRIFSSLNSVTFIYDNLATIIAVLLVYPPVIISLFDKKRITYWEMSPQIIIHTLKAFGLISVIVFPLAFGLNHLYQGLFFDRVYHAGSSDIWLMYAVMQLFLITIPEEFFFRGFLQEAFNKKWPAQKMILGVKLGKSTLYLSILFALSHSLITLQWWHAFIFFPALAFSWLKEKTGTIWAGSLFHWACNLFAYWVAIHY